MKTKLLKTLVIVLTSTGVLFIALGILISLAIQVEKDRAIQDLWLKPEKFDLWGKIPGEAEIELYNYVTLYNYSEPESVFAGKLPKVAEVPPLAYREVSNFEDWYYTNEAGENFGQDIPSDLIAYHNNQTNSPARTQPISSETVVTAFNSPVYGAFFEMCNSPAPLYMVPNIYEVIITFENEFFDTLIAYPLFQLYFGNSDFASAYLKQAGFTKNDIEFITEDTDYGWANWTAFKVWVVAILQNMEGHSYYDGAVESLNDHFRIKDLNNLLTEDSLLYELVEATLTDMQIRYGTTDKFDIACMQWALSTPTLDLPLGLGNGPVSQELPFPTYLNLNLTFSYLPEILYVLEVTKNPQNFSGFAPGFLKHPEGYPKPSSSLMNLNTLGAFFEFYEAGAFSEIQKIFGLDQEQAKGLYDYLADMVNLPQNWKTKKYKTDGYAMMLSRWTHRNLVDELRQLRTDVVWGFPAMLLLCDWHSKQTTCEEIISAMSKADPKTVCTGRYGWDVSDINSWPKLAKWVEASQKSNTSESYRDLLYNSGAGIEVDTILYNTTLSIQVLSTPLFSKIAQQFQCSSDPCSQDELFFKQWGSSDLTLHLPDALLICGFELSFSISDYCDHYKTPAEWRPYSKFFSVPEQQAKELINYQVFLNPSKLRLFYNKYFAGNTTELVEIFSLANVEMVKNFYNYFLAMIPGLSFFRTQSLKDWVEGYTEPFYEYVGSDLTIETGGYPILEFATTQRLLPPLVDTKSTPFTMIYSGLKDPGITSMYYQYYGEKNITKYNLIYDPDSKVGVARTSKNVWSEEIPLQGGNGGTFGIYVDSSQPLYVFINPLLINGKLKYDSSHDYKGINVYRYVLDPDTIKTSAYVPENKKYNQYPNGFNGFFNISSQVGAPTFAGQPRCYHCEEEAKKMVEYYAYDTEKPFSKRIYPSEKHCGSFSTIEPLSGVAVQDVLNIEVYSAIYPDYFFNDVVETVPGKGMYLPYYALQQSQNYSQGQINKYFSAIKQANLIKRYVFYCGVVIGCFFILLALVLIANKYRVDKFGGWTSKGASVSFKRALSGIPQSDDSITR